MTIAYLLEVGIRGLANSIREHCYYPRFSIVYGVKK